MNKPGDLSFADAIFYGGDIITPEGLDPIEVIRTYRGETLFSKTELLSQ